MTNKKFHLVRKEYYKVAKDAADYFFLKRFYTCSSDGDITTNFITEETYYKNLEENKNGLFFEIEYNQADRAIKSMIDAWEMCHE